MYMLDLFVKVPSGAVAPIKYKPMEIVAIHQVADGRKQRDSLRLIATNQLFGGRSERGRQVQAD